MAQVILVAASCKVLDMRTAIAQARHAGYFGAWEGKYNPYMRGSRLWKEFNYGRRVAASVPLGQIPQEYLSL